jgi:hypothetical protein
MFAALYMSISDNITLSVILSLIFLKIFNSADYLEFIFSHYFPLITVPILYVYIE